jgi:hypothetical protein
MEAGDDMIGTDETKLRHRRPRLLVGARTTVGERAVPRRLGERGDTAWDLLESPVSRHARAGNRAQ